MRGAVLVTGGAGFIGSHVSDILLSQGYPVIIVDNLSTGRRKNLPARAQFYHLDLRYTKRVRAIFEQFLPASVIHLAAQVSVPKSIEDPITDADENVMNTVRLLDLAKTFRVRNFVLSSSCAVYGDPIRLPAEESDRKAPRAPYAISKMAAEGYARYYGRDGMKTVILRYANVYGPRQDAEREAGVIAVFFAAARAGRPARIFGDGLQTRDFVSVRDVAQANLLALESDKPGTYNIGTGIGTTVLKIERVIRAMTASPALPLHSTIRDGDIRHMILNNARARDLLGWTPQDGIEDGLQEMTG